MGSQVAHIYDCVLYVCRTCRKVGVCLCVCVCENEERGREQASERARARALPNGKNQKHFVVDSSIEASTLDV